MSTMMLRPAISALQRRYVSYLYVPRHKANERVAVLIPHFDFKEFGENLSHFEADFRARNFNAQLDIQKALNLRKTSSNLRDKLQIHEKQHESMNSRFQACKLSGETIAEDLKIKLKENKEEMKSLSLKLSLCEQELYNIVLKFPNRIHKRTPKDKELVSKTVRNPPEFTGQQLKSHSAIGSETGAISFSDVSPNAYYLQGNIAHLELALQFYFMDHFTSFTDFQPFSNPHICKSIVVEGTAMDISNPDKVFLLRNSNQSNELDLNLVGGSSLAAFCAYFAKSVISAEELPFCAVTMGRSYSPRAAKDQTYGLYRASQSSEVSYFAALRNHTEHAETMYAKCVGNLENAYEKLGLHFRTVICAAKDLDVAESSRTEIQLWSPYFRKYFPVAFVASLDDYISKRLLMYYSDDGKENGKYLNLIYGKAVTVPPVLASMVENAQSNSFDVPLCLKPHINRP